MLLLSVLTSHFSLGTHCQGSGQFFSPPKEILLVLVLLLNHPYTGEVLIFLRSQLQQRNQFGCVLWADPGLGLLSFSFYKSMKTSTQACVVWQLFIEQVPACPVVEPRCNGHHKGRYLQTERQSKQLLRLQQNLLLGNLLMGRWGWSGQRAQQFCTNYFPLYCFCNITQTLLIDKTKGQGMQQCFRPYLLMVDTITSLIFISVVILAITTECIYGTF